MDIAEEGKKMSAYSLGKESIRDMNLSGGIGDGFWGGWFAGFFMD